MKKIVLFISLVLLALSSCSKGGLEEGWISDGLIVFQQSGLLFSASAETKATEVTESTLNGSGFNVSCTTGSAGSESNVWNNVAFSKSGSYFVAGGGGKWWPDTNPSYHFFASNAALTFNAGGCTVAATNASDVVCAYMPSPTYKSRNTLQFKHIFARITDVTFSAADGYTISGISVYVTPKTGGTYNLRTGSGQTDGTGWSSLTTGSATAIANSTPGTKSNNLYLVPGRYTISASWTATKGDYTKTFSNKTYEINVVGGKCNVITASLVGDASAIEFAVSITPWSSAPTIERVAADYQDNLDYLTFYCDEAGTIGWKCSDASIARTIQYSKDFGATWTDLTSTTSGATVAVNAGDIVWFKGSNGAYSNGSYFNQFTLSNKAHVYGNVNSLTGNYTSVSEYCFLNLFRSCFNLYTYEHKKIILPATTLANRCYANMFYGCSSLKTVPELPNTTLADQCYYGMFSDCTSLKAAPELPATTLAYRCYFGMFSGCTSLTIAPQLPATTLASDCYYAMFNNCTLLTLAPELPATTLANGCYGSMFQGCTSLTTAPELPATTLAQNCYGYMFYGCTSLTTAPELPATTLANSCHQFMFYGCTSLNYIKALFTTTPSSTYTYNWVRGVAPTGTFVKSSAATWNVTGNNGVPTGWTVITE